MDKEQISQTALELFHQRGYSQVTVQDICDACGISKPTFYSRFPSKGDLIVDFYDVVTKRLNESLSSLMDTTSAWEQLRICFGTLMDETESAGPELMAVMISINLDEDRGSFDERQYLTDTVVAIIARGQRTGEIGNKQEARQLYEVAAYLFQGYMTMWCIRKGKMAWRDEFEKSLAAMLEVRQREA